MAGLIESAAPALAAPQGSAPSDDGKKNDVLTQAEERIRSQIRPQDMPAVQKIVLSGRKVLYGEQTNQLVMEQLEQPGDKATLVGRGVMLLLLRLYQESKRTLPWGPAVPAGILLICDVLDFAEQIGVLKADAKTLGKATEAFLAAFVRKLGLNPAQLKSMQPSAAPEASAEEEGETETESPDEDMTEDDEEER